VNLPEQGGDGNDEADGGNRDRQPVRDCHIRMIEQAMERARVPGPE
jgi:hypothetical protein